MFLRFELYAWSAFLPIESLTPAACMLAPKTKKKEKDNKKHVISHKYSSSSFLDIITDQIQIDIGARQVKVYALVLKQAVCKHTIPLY
ncbi:hypothetical protein A9P44_13200 [Paenibacillus polymyxa]|nr:hypothetical protein A9P44_13200 [Paenibacillus polymyxa]